ncbi:MAG: NAD(P)-dependent oxidoreductase [Candidatus Lokiarchaeota archaeon]|nr:NAD(P)-dependent oxidoreductase [Candidatus Lokiarchaeota archaeon]
MKFFNKIFFQNIASEVVFFNFQKVLKTLKKNKIMKVFVTGAFGNVGESALIALFKKGYDVTCFDIKNKNNQKKAEELSKIGSFKTIWGDITKIEDVKNSLIDFECIIHLAAIIPPVSEDKPDLARRVNIDGTRNLIEVAQEINPQPRFIFTSSISTHGPRMADPPPRKADETLKPTDNYTHSKVECEKMIKESTLPWIIFRLAAVPPFKIDLNMAKVLFDMPLEQRVEFVHTRDVGTALANAVTAEAIHKILLIGGGKECQMLNRVFLTKTLEAFGIKLPSDMAFKLPKTDNDWFYTDWMDTEESQRLLNFQNTTYDEYIKEMKMRLGWKRFFIKLVSPIARWYLTRSSPYLKENKKNLNP